MTVRTLLESIPRRKTSKCSWCGRRYKLASGALAPVMVNGLQRLRCHFCRQMLLPIDLRLPRRDPT